MKYLKAHMCIFEDRTLGTYGAYSQSSGSDQVPKTNIGLLYVTLTAGRIILFV
jgi:hypothetical protein